MTSRSLGHRAPLLWLVLPFIAGLVAGRSGEFAPVPWQLAGALAAGLFAIFASGRRPRLWAPALVAAMFLAGSASYALHRARLAAWDVLPPREVRVALRVDRTFPQTDATRASGLATVVRADEHLRELAGQRLYFSLVLRRGETPPLRGAIVSAVGVLVTLPRDPAANSFDGYLVGAGMNFRLTRGRIVATEEPAPAYRQFCARATAKFAAILSAGVGPKRPELTGVFRAMLLGQKHELSDEQDALFMRSGTMHLFAISGLHIGVIALGLHALLTLVRLPRIARFLFGIVALWLYVDITGAAPSAVRAFIMVALVQAALVLRVPGNPVAALAASAALVALLWPMQVFSASFQMSYGIVAALLLLGLPLAEVWQDRWRWFRTLPVPAWRWYHRWLDGFRRDALGAVAIGLAATLVSTISGVWIFQLFTPASLLANLVLIPAASLVILGGFVSLVCGLLGALPLSAFFNHAAVFGLWVIDAGVRKLVALPGTWREASFSTEWIGPAALTAVLAAMIAGYAARWDRRLGSWWPPFVIVAGVLLFGLEFG